MKEIIDWLLRDEQKEVFDALFAIAMCILFLALTALLLWPLNESVMALPMARGYLIFWLVLSTTGWILSLLRRLLRVDLDTNFDTYVISALAVSCFLQAGWSAFAALTVYRFIEGDSLWVAILLYGVGFFSCYIAFLLVSAFYPGQIYKMVNLILFCVSYIMFCILPGIGRIIYGWFFDLF